MAALTPVASVEALVRAIEKSGLIATEAFDQVREAAAKANDPKALARDLVKAGSLTRWQAEQLINGYHRLTVGKYKLLDQIGTVPTGRLYLAEHSQFGRRHTLKVLARRLASNPVAVNQFLASAQNACGLDHRNISHVYDVSQDKTGYFVVMEHVEGQDLEQLVERTGRVNVALALNFIGQAAEGLAYAHAKGVVHGDLKPLNLFRDHSGTIKILEIGQAGTGAIPEAEGADESVEMAALAAVIFQAPELRGDGEAANVACDVYSIGSVLCFLLTGRAAKDATAAVKTLEAIAEIPHEAIALVSRLMAVEPAERPATMEEVQAAVGIVARKLAEDEIAKRNKRKQPANSLPKAVPLPVGNAIAASGGPPIVVVQPPAPMEPPAPLQIKARAKTGNVSNPHPTSNPIFTQPLLAAAIGGGAMLVLALCVALICVLAFSRANGPVAEATKPASAIATDDLEAANVAVAKSQPDSIPSDTIPAAVAPPRVQNQPSAVVGGENVLEVTAPKAPIAATANVNPEPAAAVVPERLIPKSSPIHEPPSDPFADFANAVSLPDLPDAASAVPNLSVAPAVLGPCTVKDGAPLAIALLGGDTAIRGARQKFELHPREGSPRACDITLSGNGESVAIATLDANNGNLMFRWTEAGARQAALSKQLCNCALALGKSRKIVALREAAVGAPLVVEIEKPGAAVKWNIGDLPVAKQIFVEVTQTEGFENLKQDPKNPVNVGDPILIASGPAEKSIPLQFKLNTASTADAIEVKLQTSVKLEGRLDSMAYRRKELLALQPQLREQLTRITADRDSAKAKRPSQPAEKEAQKATVDRLAREITSLNILLDQLRYVTDFSATTNGQAKIHFRVYFLCGDTKIDLLKTVQELPTEASR